MAQNDTNTKQRYSDMLKAKLRFEAVLKDGVVFNNSYEGDPKAGVVQIPVRDTEVVVGNYSKSAGLAADTSSGATTYERMDIDKDVAVNEIIDGFDAASVPANLVADRLDSAGYSLAQKLDFDGAYVLLVGSTKNYAVEAITSSNIYDYCVDMRTAMSKAGVPNDGKRYLLVSSDAYALMLKDKTNFIRQGDIAQEIKATGAIGQYVGFNVYEFNLTGTNASSYSNFVALAGHPLYASRVNEWKIAPYIENAGGAYVGASAVKGRMVYGHKALRATALQFLGTITPLGVTAAAGTSGTATVTVTGTGSGSTLRYRKNPAVNAIYGQTAVNGTNGFVTFTSAGANGVTAAVGDVIEVVEVLTATGLVIARGVHTLVTGEVGT